jgi:hypothetical protein
MNLDERLVQFQDMWGKDRIKYVLWGKQRYPGGPLSYTIYERGDKPAFVLIDENDELADEVKRRMLAAGVPVMCDPEEGVRKGYFRTL